MGKVQDSEQTIEIDLNREEYAYLRGNIINGKISIPLSYCLIKTWKILKSFSAEPMLNVVFENIQVHELILNVPDSGKIKLTFMVSKGTGKFQVASESNIVVISGTIKMTQTPDRERLNLFDFKKEIDEKYELDENDFYTEMEMRGYKYVDQFRTVLKSSIDDTKALLKWNDNWVTYMDGALQFYASRRDMRQVEIPLSIRKIVIDNGLHESIIKNNNEIDIFVNGKINCLSAGGLEIQGIKLSVVPKQLEQNRLSADTWIMVPNVHESAISIATGLRLILQLVFENIFVSKMPVIQVVNCHNSEYIQSDMMNNIPEASLFKIDYNISYQNATFNKALTIIEDEITNYDINDISRKLGIGKFILTFVSSANLKSIIKLMESYGLKIIFLRKLRSEYIVLLRKKQINSKLHTVDISQNIIDSIKKLDEIKAVSEHERVVVIIRPGTDIHLNDLKDRLESRFAMEKIRIFDLRNLNTPDHSLINLLQEQLESDILVNILTSENTWATLRRVTVTLKPKLCKSWRANQKYLHDPTTYTWTEGPTISSTTNTVKVEYSSLNPQDLLIANGTFYANSSKLEGKNRIEPISIGLEFSGTDSNGNRVMGITQGNAMSNYVNADQDWTWSVPQSWSLEDAATVPLSYVIAYSACYIKAKIKPEEKVILVNPSTEVGLATLNLALHMKCDVFVTYENLVEKKFLQSIVPNIQEGNMLEFAADSFQNAVLAATGGRGADVVICNKCNMEDVNLFLTILNRDSRVIMINDLSNDMIHKNIGMYIFLQEVGFYSIVPEKVLLYDSKTKKSIASMVNEGINAGHVKPLAKVLYDRNSLNEALIACKEHKHRGKIVVKTQPEESKTDEALAIPRLYCSESNSYIILEGLTHFGLELTDWLITRGAKKFIVTSANKVNNGYAKLRMKYWKDYGINYVLHEEFNYSNKQNIEAIFKEARSFGQLDGLFDLRQTETSNKSMSAFDAITLVIDKESRALGAQMRLFVACSIATNSLINAKMYSSAQVMEKVLNKRKEDGLPGILIKWKLTDTIKRIHNDVGADVTSLPISKYLRKLDEILGTEESIAEVSYVSPASKEVEEDVVELKSRMLDPARQEFESFTASLYQGRGVNVDFYSLELEV